MSHPDLTTLKKNNEIVLEVTDAENEFIENGLVTNHAFAPPYGAFNNRVVNILKNAGVISSLRRAWSYADGINYPATFDPWAIEAYYINKNTTFADLKAKVDQAVAQGGLFVPVVHKV